MYEIIIPLQDRDVYATILKFMLHTIGFDHHQRRSDRDKYIEIHLENTNLDEFDVKRKYAKYVQFKRRLKYVRPFDFESIMLHGVNDDSINDRPVIISKIKDKKLPTFRLRGLSVFDKVLLNHFYDCNKKKSRPSVMGENETFAGNVTDSSRVVGNNETFHKNGIDNLHLVVGGNETSYGNVTDNSHPVVEKNEIFYENGTDRRHLVVGNNETFHQNGADNHHPVVGQNETFGGNVTDNSHSVVGKDATFHQNETDSFHQVVGELETFHETDTDIRHLVVGKNESFYESVTENSHLSVGKNYSFYKNETDPPTVEKNETFHQNETESPAVKNSQGIHLEDAYSTNNSAVSIECHRMAGLFVLCVVLLAKYFGQL